MSKFITIWLLAGSTKVSSRWAWASVSPQSLWLQWSTAGLASSWVGVVSSTLPGYLLIHFYGYGDVRLCCDWRTEAWFTGITQPSGTAGTAYMRRSMSFLHLNILTAKKNLREKFCAEALNSSLMQFEDGCSVPNFITLNAVQISPLFHSGGGVGRTGMSETLLMKR